MDKYGVVTKDDDLTKTAAKKGTCPQCGADLDPKANVPKCPKCGTAPFESRKEDGPKEDDQG